MNVTHRKITFAIIFAPTHQGVTLVHVDRDTRKQVLEVAQVMLIYIVITHRVIKSCFYPIIAKGQVQAWLRLLPV